MAAEQWVGSGEQSGMRTRVTEHSQIERGRRDVDWPAGSLWGSGERNGMRIYMARTRLEQKEHAHA